jgi:serine/threonine protein kinase
MSREDNYCKKIKDYIFMKLLGRGAYSSVWLAYNLYSEKFYAIKSIEHEERNTAQRELEFNKRLLESKNLKILKDSFEDEENTYMVFNLYGGSLYELYKYNTIPPKVLLRIYESAVSKIRELHKGFKCLHGDIKPESFMYRGKNPICKDFIERFTELGGIKAFLTKTNNNMKEALDLLKKELYCEEDFNSDLFSVYNSSNESGSETNTTEYEKETSEESNESDSGDKQENRDDEDDEDKSSSSEESDLSTTSSSFSNSSVDSVILDYRLTEEEIDNLKIDLIDYSHVHTLSDDLKFEPTRYYRCIDTLEGKPAGYYKDWYALATTMYELENREIFADPQSEDKDEEQINYIKENMHKLEKWLYKPK